MAVRKLKWAFGGTREQWPRLDSQKTLPIRRQQGLELDTMAQRTYWKLLRSWIGSSANQVDVGALGAQHVIIKPDAYY